jgi:AMP deaminase
MIKGRFLAETIREVIDQLEASKYQCSEFRVSVYGRFVLGRAIAK